ncbi:hypothetical protein RchiOBHm_Chr2g0106521 [Rosa chinensis]|uniref:Uncharacterized protein n=1 Tax=Rosa chinensis TaxID=74649 RepID=A0A2P6RNQ9_ROSCH|nr:hypothetical protein RchiOBHm_Chr2g0106521 [Rosa chinensis]
MFVCKLVVGECDIVRCVADLVAHLFGHFVGHCVADLQFILNSIAFWKICSKSSCISVLLLVYYYIELLEIVGVEFFCLLYSCKLMQSLFFLRLMLL